MRRYTLEFVSALCAQKLSSEIYTTIGALCAKICPQNRTDFYQYNLNSTPIIA